ncbi:MAG: hypothetical protein KAQ93_09625 [Spirochaetales bacterium]|nr:hypothetical protein [Spirochaetales bacterium]MCK5200399.1 hypothetical protein [Spirochaetales bacterium]
MVLTKKYLEKYQNNTRQTIPDTIAEELLLELGQPFIDDDGHVNEYSEQDIFEQVRKAFQRHFEEVKP